MFKSGGAKVFGALLIQLVALAGLAGALYFAPQLIAPPYPLWALVMVQALLAALLSWKLAPWWRWIQFLLPWAFYVAWLTQFNPWWALGVFVVLWLVFANVNKERVPLYLTNAVTRQALKVLVEERVAQTGAKLRFMDLGCGLGGNVVFMAQLPQIERAVGVETAPLPFWIARVSAGWRGGEVRAQDLWTVDLSGFDLVYAFLSPEPMPRLWHKVQREMREGSVFVSNSFAVPDVQPTEVWELSDARQTRLFLYVLGNAPESELSLSERRV